MNGFAPIMIKLQELSTFSICSLWFCVQLEQDKLRSVQKETYLKMARCYDVRSASAQDIQRCLENSSRPVQFIQSSMQQELQLFEQRLQRCAQDCQDQVRDRYAGQQMESSAAQGMMDNCVSSCFDKQAQLLRGLQQALERKVEEGKRM